MPRKRSSLLLDVEEGEPARLVGHEAKSLIALQVLVWVLRKESFSLPDAGKGVLGHACR